MRSTVLLAALLACLPAGSALAQSPLPTNTFPPAIPITGIAPDNGLTTGGTVVTLTGIKFGGVTAVRFGDVPAQSFSVDGFNTITAVSPPHAAGTVAVYVLRGAWSQPSPPFTYVEPLVEAAPPLVVAPPVEATCHVPDLTGRTLEGARSKLAAAGCALGTVSKGKPRRGARRVRVVRQSAAPGKALPGSTAVSLALRAIPDPR
jgi:hypothetical protein